MKIVQKDAPVLRKISKEIPIKEIKTAKIQKIIKEMRVALNSQEDGVAIAAPQIGYPLRIFIVSDKVTEIAAKPNRESIEQKEPRKLEHSVYINPQIIKLSQKKKEVEEGCLSVRYLYGTVKRSDKALVKSYDENGKNFTMGASGLLAQIFQHEIDHLNGVLFIDKAKRLEEIQPNRLKTK